MWIYLCATLCLYCHLEFKALKRFDFNPASVKQNSTEWKNSSEGAFLAEVIIHVGRDTRKESCFKTHEEIAETNAALGNKVWW